MKEALSAQMAKEKLMEGNRIYRTAKQNPGNISPEIRDKTAKEGQSPYAIILCCSDSRAIPEAIFSAGIGELFVIRVAGNVVDSHQLGSIEYAAGHLGCRLVVVLGHDHCGAVDAALHHVPDGNIKHILDEILEAIGTETDEYKASRLNVLHSVDAIRKKLDPRILEDHGLQVIGAMYHLQTGEVEFLS